MTKIFVTTQYRYRAQDFWGLALSETGEVLAETAAKDLYWLKYDLGLEGFASIHDLYHTHFPEGYEIIFVDQLDTHPEFNQALNNFKNRVWLKTADLTNFMAESSLALDL